MSSNETKEIILFFWDKKENIILTKSRKSAQKCVLEAKFYYQKFYYPRYNSTKGTYQTDTQVNLNYLNFTKKNCLSHKKRELK